MTSLFASFAIAATVATATIVAMAVPVSGHAGVGDTGEAHLRKR